MSYVTLPKTLTIDGLVNVQEWRSRDFVIYQNYADTDPPTEQPLQQRARVTGQNWFHLFRIIATGPGEDLGEKIGAYRTLEAALQAMQALTI